MMGTIMGGFAEQEMNGKISLSVIIEAADLNNIGSGCVNYSHTHSMLVYGTPKKRLQWSTGNQKAKKKVTKVASRSSRELPGLNLWKNVASKPAVRRKEAAADDGAKAVDESPADRKPTDKELSDGSWLDQTRTSQPW